MCKYSVKDTIQVGISSRVTYLAVAIDYLVVVCVLHLVLGHLEGLSVIFKDVSVDSQFN